MLEGLQWHGVRRVAPSPLVFQFSVRSKIGTVYFSHHFIEWNSAYLIQEKALTKNSDKFLNVVLPFFKNNAILNKSNSSYYSSKYQCNNTDNQQ